MLKTTPAVFCVGNEYHIMAPAATPSLFSVRVGDTVYRDDSCGVLRSSCPVHRVVVPTCELNRTHAYTVLEREVPDRRAYYTKVGDETATTYRFDPLPEDNIRLFQVADAHNNVGGPVACGKAFGDFDLLVFNGDVADAGSDAAFFDTIYKIADELTHGTKPVVLTRGNHTLRGVLAERLADYIPTDNGTMYYTARLGSLWVLVLDCAEDKVDNCVEYGGVNDCASFRRREDKWLDTVVKNAKKEYKAPGVKHRLVLAHKPFSFVQEPPFDIEQDIYRRWCTVLRKKIRPELMLSGHLHRQELWLPGCESDHLGQPCPVVVGNVPGELYRAVGVVLGQNEVTVSFISSDGTRTDTRLPL